MRSVLVITGFQFFFFAKTNNFFLMTNSFVVCDKCQIIHSENSIDLKQRL